MRNQREDNSSRQGKTTQHPLESNSLSHPSLSRFSVLMEGFLSYVPQLRRYGPLGGLNAFKTGPREELLQLGKNKKVTICPATTIFSARALSKVAIKRSVTTELRDIPEESFQQGSEA